MTRRHVVLLATAATGWALAAAAVFVYVDRKVAQAAGWLA